MRSFVWKCAAFGAAVVSAWIAGAVPAVADENDARTLAPFLSANTAAVATVNLADEQVSALLRTAASFAEIAAPGGPATTAGITETLDKLRAARAAKAFLV